MEREKLEWLMNLMCGFHQVHKLREEAASAKSAKPSSACIHRIGQVGFVDCGCSGNKSVYQCGKLSRPNVLPAEPAYCVDSMPKKRTKILGMDGKTVIAKLSDSELIECWPMCDHYE